jgi:hypothetical protein
MYFWPFENIQVSDRFADGLIKAGLPGGLGGYYKISKENRLTGDAIKDLLFGRKVVGRLRVGLRMGMSVEWTKDGEAKLENPYGRTETGRSWVEGDMICNDFPSFFDRLEGEYCASVFRNPDGKSEMENEYLMIMDFGIFSFSPVE